MEALALGKRLPYCGAVVPAAGKSTRMGGKDKLFALLDGKPLIMHTLKALNRCPDIHLIVVVTRPENIELLSHLCVQNGINKIRSIVQGGETRALSVMNGLISLPQKCELAAIHDAARPFVTSDIISAAIHQAARTGAAAPAIPTRDTVKMVEDGRTQKTLDRESVVLIQTPQVFNAGLLKGALTQAIREDWEITDDCGAVERMGMPVTITEGAYSNFKVTTPEDLIIARAMMENKDENRTRV